MSAPTIANPAAAIRPATRRRPRSRLRPVPDAPATQEVLANADHAAGPAADLPAAPAVHLVVDGADAVSAPAALAFSDAPATRAGRRRASAAERPLTVTISIDGGGQDGRDRILAALRDLVEAVGGDPVVTLGAPAARGDGQANGAGSGIVNLDTKPRAAIRDGSVLDLSRLEYDLLLFFAENPRQVFSRAQLLERVWGHVHTGARTVDVHISRLRNKLDDHELIITVYGIGYRLADDALVRVV